nr:tyrosine-type recombinase/integrase [Micromonospora parathelypteridis]
MAAPVADATARGGRSRSPLVCARGSARTPLVGCRPARRDADRPARSAAAEVGARVPLTVRPEARRALPRPPSGAGRYCRDQVSGRSAQHRPPRRTGGAAPQAPRRAGLGARHRRPALGGWRLAVCQADRRPGEPANRLRRVEAAAQLAGLRDSRLHDARHTAATVLLILGVAERAVMGIMGWSNSAMAARYQHLTAQVRRDIAQRVGGLLWDSPTEDSKLTP